LFSRNELFIQRHLEGLSPSLRKLPFPRIVNQDAPHHLGRNAKEVGPALPLNIPLIDQPQEGFIHESGRLQGMTRAFSFNVPMCKSVKFRIDEGHQLIACGLIAMTPSD